MNDLSILNRPTALEAILRETAELGFSMASELQTGSLLRTLAASKPAGIFLELGTGTGVATAWLLDGMDKAARLESVENDPTVIAIARKYLGSDRRVTFHLDDAAAFIERQTPGSYDFVFANAWPGKFSHLERAQASALEAFTSLTTYGRSRTGPMGTRRQSQPLLNDWQPMIGSWLPNSRGLRV